MNLDVPQIGVAEFALRAGTAPGWSALVVAPEHAEETANLLAEELQALDRLPIVCVAPATPEDMVHSVQAAGDRTVVIRGLEGFSARDWQHVDLLRSRLARAGCTVLLLSSAAISRFAEAAPNLSSWLGSTVWRADLGADVLSPLETQRRLGALREHTGLADDDVLARAERGELPGDPEFAEWLILLGRGDLVPRG